MKHILHSSMYSNQKLLSSAETLASSTFNSWNYFRSNTFCNQAENFASFNKNSNKKIWNETINMQFNDIW